MRKIYFLVFASILSLGLYSDSSGQVVKVSNPDISLISDVRAWYTSEGPRNVDMELHEVETSFRSVIDPFARADIFVGMGHDNGEFAFELEEAYLSTLSLPYQLQVKAGKFRSNVGKINRLHPHSLPFIDVPAVYANFFGDEGLNDQGFGVNWLIPNMRFYQELSVEVTRGPAENVSFEYTEGNKMLYTSHLKNFWDLSDNASLEFGLSGLTGPNNLGLNTTMFGADLTYKWKPLQFNTYKSLTIQLEAFQSRKEMGSSTIKASGMYALVNYQLARRWFLSSRFDHADLPEDPDWNEKAVSTTLGWYLSEYQKIELGGRTSWGPGLDQSYQALLGIVFVIGTHGAHEY